MDTLKYYYLSINVKETYKYLRQKTDVICSSSFNNVDMESKKYEQLKLRIHKKVVLQLSE